MSNGENQRMNPRQGLFNNNMSTSNNSNMVRMNPRQGLFNHNMSVSNNNNSQNRNIIQNQERGIQIISRAIEAPLRTIVENAGGEGSVVVAKVLEGKANFGYDAKSENYVDLLKEGIIDPKKVTRIALENASSVAGMILTTECALVDIKEDAPAAMPPMGGGGGMPGMM